MAITTALPTSFKQELMVGTHNFTLSTGDVFKIALIKPSMAGTYGAASTAYANITGNADEASGTGYLAGGATLTNVTPTTTGTTAFADFSDNTWSTASFSADGCMIYNSTDANRAVYLGDFGGTKTSSGGDFVVQFPVADSSTAIIRLA